MNRLENIRPKNPNLCLKNQPYDHEKLSDEDVDDSESSGELSETDHGLDSDQGLDACNLQAVFKQGLPSAGADKDTAFQKAMKGLEKFFSE